MSKVGVCVSLKGFKKSLKSLLLTKENLKGLYHKLSLVKSLRAASQFSPKSGFPIPHLILQ